MTPVPFFLIPLALATGFVAGLFVMWLRVKGQLRQLRDARIVFLTWCKSIHDLPMEEFAYVLRLTHNLHRALSDGKPTKVK